MTKEQYSIEMSDFENETYLIECCLKNNRSAQAFLYKKYADKMYSVCLTYAKDSDEACDFLQDAFIKVFKKLDQHNQSGVLGAWIRRIIVNTCLDGIRKKKRLSEVFEPMEKYHEIIEEHYELDSIPANKIMRLVNELPEKASIVMKLFTVEGFGHQEIADHLGITVGTSKSQLSRAKFLLKTALNQSAH
jgi:RNA polymerase sigma-70 factor (ECF subfamily)